MELVSLRPIQLALAATLAATLASALPARATPAESFQAESADAMDRMMTDMSVAPTGDVDTDFVNMMEPHHAGAIAMAVAELRYGKNEQLRRLAQEIVVEQRQEIDAMRLALDRPPLPPAPVPTQPSLPIRPAHQHAQVLQP